VTTSAPDQDPGAALEVVRAELDRAQASCEARSTGVDTKAGLLLAAAGVLIGFQANKATVVNGTAAIVAAVAGGLAIWALHPRRGQAVNPRVLYEAYLNQPSLDLRQEMIKGRLVVWEQDEAALSAKARRLFLSAIFLGLSGLLFLAGSILSLASPVDQTQPPVRSSTAPTGQAAPTASTGSSASPATLIPSPRRTGAPTSART
jgi:hypothetical protein